jgi:putative phage-type endonuclease
MDPATRQVRRSVLGASEVPAVCGLDPFKSAADIWALKRGLVDQEDSEAADMGNLLEPVLIEEYARRLNPGWPAQVEKPPAFRRGYRQATLDAVIEGRNVQVKVVGEYMTHHWADGVPDYVQAQVQAEMDVSNLAETDIIALIGGTDFRTPIKHPYRIQRDPDAIAVINRACDRFWEKYILGDGVPDISKSRVATKIAAARYPKGSGLAHAVPAFVAMAERYASLGRIAKESTEERASLAICMKMAIGDKEGLEWPGGRVTWRGKTSRTFRVKVKGQEENDD